MTASITKPSFLALPSSNIPGRTRSKTLTTPAGTPLEGMSVFITPEMLAQMTTPKSKNWDRLPRELKSHVLSFLSATDRIRCMSVNRELNAMVKDGSLWQTLDASSFYSKIPATQLYDLIQQASPFVQNLNLRGCSQLKPGSKLHLTNLVRASFEGCRFLDTECLDMLLARNTRLRHINISGLRAVNDSTMRTLAMNCTNLQSLDLSYCKQISIQGLESVLSSLLALVDLRLGECRIAQTTAVAIHRLKHLTRLSLAGCTDLRDSWVKDMIYGHLEYGIVYPETRVSSSLVHLNLSRCTSLSSDAFKYLSWVMPALQKLELSGLPRVTDQGLCNLLPSLPSLTHLDLEDCVISDMTLLSLATNENVRHLQLSHCTEITDRGVLALVERLPLTQLDLDNTNITDRVLSAIATKPQKMKLSIYDCPSLSWTGVLSILTANSARPGSLKRVKTFYGWQRPVDGHTKRCSRGDIKAAKEVEREWANYMIGSSEELLRTGEARTRFLDFDEEGMRIVGRERHRPRACLVM